MERTLNADSHAHPQIHLAFSWSLSLPPSLPLWSSISSGAYAGMDDGSKPSSSSSASESSVAHPDLKYEQASLLFSLAALYSALGAAESRSNKESLKRSISYFQSAAGVLRHVRTTLVAKIAHLTPACSDLTPSVLEALEQVMLAQAQECFWQQAVLGEWQAASYSK